MIWYPRILHVTCCMRFGFGVTCTHLVHGVTGRVENEGVTNDELKGFTKALQPRPAAASVIERPGIERTRHSPEVHRRRDHVMVPGRSVRCHGERKVTCEWKARSKR